MGNYQEMLRKKMQYMLWVIANIKVQQLTVSQLNLYFP